MNKTLVVFAGPVQEAAYLDGAAREDARDPLLVALGAELRRRCSSARELGAAIYQLVRQIRFFPDVHGEEFDSAALTLSRGADDCDGLARLFVALCIACGLDARMRAVLSEDGEMVEHYQGLVLIEGEWNLAELTLAGLDLGQGAEAGKVDGRGNYRLV